MTKLVVMLSPEIELLPLSVRRFDEPLLPFSKGLVHATYSSVCGYVFNFASYLALGASGAAALERSIAYAHSFGLTILHGPFATTEYSAMASQIAFGLDAITVTEYGILEHYLNNPPYFAFIANNNLEANRKGSNYYCLTNQMLVINSQSDHEFKLRVIFDKQLYDTRDMEEFTDQASSSIRQFLISNSNRSV